MNPANSDWPRGSHLFTVRLWNEDLGSGQNELRGKIQHVVSGKVHYFRDWPTLISLLLSMLPPDSDVALTDMLSGLMTRHNSPTEVLPAEKYHGSPTAMEPNG